MTYISALKLHIAVTSPDIVALHESVATAHANAHNAHVISQLHARVAEALRAPTISAESPPIPDSVATAERIRPRFASLIVPLHSIVDSMFIPSAQDPVTVPVPISHTFDPIPHAFGGNSHE